MLYGGHGAIGYQTPWVVAGKRPAGEVEMMLPLVATLLAPCP